MWGMKAKPSKASACEFGLGDSFFMRAGLAGRKVPEKKTLSWDHNLRALLAAHHEPNRAVQAATGPVANRRNRPKANACRNGPGTATSPPLNPRRGATLSTVAERCEAWRVVSDQRTL